MVQCNLIQCNPGVMISVHFTITSASALESIGLASFVLLRQKMEKFYTFVVALAQLVERLLLTPEILGSNPVIGKFYLPSYLLNLY